MKCPTDNATLQMTDRNGIEIDYCPECRGIWLDRGELDKLIERTGSYYSSGAMPSHDSVPTGGARPQTQPARYDDDGDDHRHHEQRQHYDNDSHQQHHKKKKEGFLGDLFDF